MELSGQDLSNCFIEAQKIINSISVSKHLAKRTEQSAIRSYHELSQGSYLNPAYIPSEAHDNLAKQSVSAHIQQAQAQQIEGFGRHGLIKLENQTKKYLNKRARISSIKTPSQIDSYWFDNRSGRLSKGRKKPMAVAGKIETIFLESNVLIIKPSTLHKLVYRSLSRYVIYVVDSPTLAPSVEIKIV